MLTHTGTQTIETERLILRRFEYSDCGSVVIERKSGQCIGQIAYFLVDSKNHFAEIEYCIGQQFQCRGFATEAAKAVIDFGFRNMNLHKVQICTKTINAPSKRVIEKCGLTYEGTLRDYFYMDGKYVGRLYFSILRDEYENREVKYD